ncbi:MAG: GMC family oxidoreductase [Nocardioides sp.]|uniref:GMC family oxidoreductase n=1 Tax=Nocardioides sp. TaxID=35761 RepID=UPI0039E4AB63
MEADDEADYVVVGAGAAGSALAGRLVAAGASVLLIDQGGGDRDPMLRVPKAFFYTMRGDRYVARYPTGPIGPDGHTETWLRGAVLGGSTAINGMMWLRGGAADFDELAALGNPGWGWDDVLPAYRAMESHVLGADERHGGDGPMPISLAPTDDPLTERILAAGAELGWRSVADIEAADGDRIGPTPQNVRRGLRVSAYRAFVRRGPRLRVLTRARVGRVLIAGGRAGRRADGVQVRHRGRLLSLRARREVILCAGALETPLLLERSGIGDPARLVAAGVAPVVESPRVGEGLREQRGIGVQVRLGADLGPTLRLDTTPKRMREAVRYLATRRGPISTGGYDLVAQFRSSSYGGETERPDVQGIIVPMALDLASPGLALAHHPGIFFLGYPIRPTTAGSIHVGGPDPDAPAVLSPRYLEEAAERAATLAALRAGRALLGAAPLAGLVAEEEAPGAAIESEDDAVRHALAFGGGIYHAVGSAAMGDEAVLDARLAVRGVEGLRVADLSALPFHVSASTAAPAALVGWRAADLLL